MCVSFVYVLSCVVSDGDPGILLNTDFRGVMSLLVIVAQAARRLATGSTAWVLSRVSEGWRFSSLLRIQTDPGVHSAYYEMNTGVKAAERRTSHPTFS